MQPGERRFYPGEVRLRGVAAPLPADLYVWPGPRSYTGQDLAGLHTLSCPPLLELLVAQLLDAGARAAGPGEFTLRAFLAGKLYFDKYYWTDGMKMLRDAIRLEPSLRTERELIRTVLRGFIVTPRADAALAAFLREDIGDEAKPYLEETASDHPNPAIRARAASELRRYR